MSQVRNFENGTGGNVFFLESGTQRHTTRSFRYKFHWGGNHDLYFQNLSQILKIHVDFCVISNVPRACTSSISEDSELRGESENRILSSQ